MADLPAFTARPFVVIGRTPPEFTVSVWTPPTGIWRRSGEVRNHAEYQAAQADAVVLAFSIGGAFVASFDAILAMPGVAE